MLRQMFLSTQLYRRTRFILWTAIPLLLWLLPATFFDDGPVMCFSRLWWNIECLGCGLTRGVMHLLHGDIAGAWAFNKLSFIALPALAVVWALWVRRFYLQSFSTSEQ